jgi:hypothetical protein
MFSPRLLICYTSTDNRTTWSLGPVSVKVPSWVTCTSSPHLVWLQQNNRNNVNDKKIKFYSRNNVNDKTLFNPRNNVKDKICFVIPGGGSQCRAYGLTTHYMCPTFSATEKLPGKVATLVPTKALYNWRSNVNAGGLSNYTFVVGESLRGYSNRTETLLLPRCMEYSFLWSVGLFINKLLNG